MKAFLMQQTIAWPGNQIDIKSVLKHLLRIRMEDRSGDIMPERKIQISISEEKLALSQDLVALPQAE